MRLRRFAVLGMACAALAGCAPFAVNWYHLPTDGSPSAGKDAADTASSGTAKRPADDDVVLAVLNRGDRVCQVESIRMNASSRTNASLVWTPNFDGAAPPSPPSQLPEHVTLAPGELLSVPLSKFRREPKLFGESDRVYCTLPLKLVIWARGCGLSEPDDFPISLPARLPNALPDGWTSCRSEQK